MSYTWSVLKTDKNSRLLGALFWGFFSMALFGAFMHVLNVEYSIWFGLFLLFIFLFTSFIFYRFKSNKKKTKK